MIISAREVQTTTYCSHIREDYRAIAARTDRVRCRARPLNQRSSLIYNRVRALSIVVVVLKPNGCCVIGADRAIVCNDIAKSIRVYSLRIEGITGGVDRAISIYRNGTVVIYINGVRASVISVSAAVSLTLDQTIHNNCCIIPDADSARSHIVSG